MGFMAALKRTFLAAGVALGLMAVAACGGDSEESESTSATATTAQMTSETTEK